MLPLFRPQIITPFNVRVRHRNPQKESCVRMSLQLYQVDNRSYLLDFTSLIDATGTRSRRQSLSAVQDEVSRGQLKGRSARRATTRRGKVGPLRSNI